MIDATGGGAATRVRLEMEVNGNVHMADNPLVDREVSLRLPMSSDAVFDYEEQPQISRNGDADPYLVARRHYHQAGSDATTNRSLRQRRLRRSAASVIVDRQSLPETIYSQDEYLTRSEVDLLRCPLSSLGVDGWMPRGEVRVGQTHRPSLTAVAAGLNLTSVQSSELELQVVDIRPDEVRWKVRGEVEGAAAGVPTKIRAIGKLTYHRDERMVRWAAVALHETRQIGVSEPGFDLTATIKMVRQSRPKPSVRLDAEVTEPRVKRNRHAAALIESRSVGVAAMMDRRWQTMADAAGRAVWRMSDHDRSVAQCDIRSLPTLPGGRIWTLADFETDIRKTLGQQYRSTLERAEATTPTGLRVMRVTAAGEAGSVPVRWTLLHFAEPIDATGPPSGKNPGGDSGPAERRRVAVTFTLAADQTDTFAGSDQQLAATLMMSTTEGQSRFDGERPIDGPAGDPTKRDHLPSGLKPATRTAAKPVRRSDERVKSISDLDSGGRENHDRRGFQRRR